MLPILIKANADFDTLDNEFHKGLNSLPNKTIVVSHPGIWLFVRGLWSHSDAY